MGERDPVTTAYGSAAGYGSRAPYGAPGSSGLATRGDSANLADILERVLDKGVVIAGDIRINLLDIELLTIKLRLIVASVDKAREMGIDWWEHDPSLSSRARRDPAPAPAPAPAPPVENGTSEEAAG
ncbi:gas vesicle protein [Streptomyces sp. NBRC 110028]|uniref:gas vesicle protein n=1 Tax=Streptomyces sp. NBRC 110028 TaxID=1621260 RepID=UPI000B0D4BAC|nr:gas vesicle protein [Streptomyces sp. NBRC 110028]